MMANNGSYTQAEIDLAYIEKNEEALKNKVANAVVQRMLSQGYIDVKYLLNNNYITNSNTRELTLIGSTAETSVTIINMDPNDEDTFGISAVNGGGESDITTVSGCVGGEAIVGDLSTPYNLVASSYCDEEADLSGMEWAWEDDNFESLLCEDGSDPLLDCVGTEFCANEPAFTSYDCIVGCDNSYLADGFCDDGAFGVDLSCAAYGGDCGDCVGIEDPDGYCDDIVVEPPVFECTSGLTVTLTDSYGDGWDGAS
jgi:hypothetical protein